MFELNDVEKSDESSSESDIENYLQKPEDLNFNSTFFKVNKTNLVNKQKLNQSKTTLSDSDSDDPLSIYVKNDEHKEPVASTSNDTSEIQYKCKTHDLSAFNNQARHALELENAKKQVEAYLTKQMAGKPSDSDKITELLALGEKPFDLAKDLADVGFHPSEFESGNESEKEDWEEVQESKEHNIIPMDGVEITLSVPDAKKKKGIDLITALKRRLNRIKKENQVYIHKVHLLAWIAHGNYVNNILNKEDIMAIALSLLPTKECYPPPRTNLKYLEQITKWYNKVICYKPVTNEQDINLEKKLLKQIEDKVATSSYTFVYIFVSMLRALGMQCRVVLSLQVEPLRPPASNLCSLKRETNVEKLDDKKLKEKPKNIKGATLKSGSSKRGLLKTDNSTESAEGLKSPRMTERKSPRIRNKPKHTSGESNDFESKKETAIEKKSAIISKMPLDTTLQNELSPKSPNKGSTKIGKRETRSRKIKTTNVSSEDCDFKKLQSSTLLKPNSTSTATRSKSASNVKAMDTLVLPSARGSSKRSKSTTSSNIRKQSLISTIDNTVAKLEALENSKPNLTKLKASSSTSDDDGFDRDLWRRSKSPSINQSSSKSKVLNKRSPNAMSITSPKQLRSRKLVFKPNPALEDSIFQTDDEKSKIKSKNKIKVRIPTQRNIPQLDGQIDDEISSSDDEMIIIHQLDGADDNDSKPKLKALKRRARDDRHSPKKVSPKTPHTDLNKLKSPPDSLYSLSHTSDSRTSSTSSYFTPDKTDVKDIIVGLVKKSVHEEKVKLRQKTVRKSCKDEDSDSDFTPETMVKKRKSTSEGKVKKRVLPRSQLEALERDKAATKKTKPKGVDVWVEVYLEEEEKWICADVVSGKVHCIKDIYSKASHPVSYILAWDNINKVKDVTKRYCPDWNTVTRKLRTDPNWWAASLKPYIGLKSARDRDEDEDLARQQLDQPLPKTISEYKNHPLYVLKRHILKFQALYPPDPPVLGFVRKEEVYSRECVYILHSREIWLKYAKVVKPGEQPYKIVKARPKYDKLSNTAITDQQLEIFGIWQVQDYEPPTAENGVVPRNAYGNVDLFKPCMLPKKCVHLQLPGLKKVAARLKIDCAPAVTGFDFHSGWNHAIYDGFIVCEEFKDVLIAAWEQEQEEIVKRENEKYEKRVFGNWRRLIKAAMIRRRLKLRYDFGENNGEPEQFEPELVKAESPSKPKRPKFMSRK